jgi:ElaB/YqjD/DUF883 family membrane-anchored ribosome-binding protein
MQSASDTDKGAGASPNSTDRHNSGGTAATELGRHYGEHGQTATANSGPSAQHPTRNAGIGEPAGAAMAKAGETAQDLANRVAEQARPAIAKITETAQDFANRAREQAAPTAQAVYDQGARAGEYVTRNVHQYPATALLIAAAVGYGLAYLIHGVRRGRREHDRHDEGAH